MACPAIYENAHSSALSTEQAIAAMRLMTDAQSPQRVTRQSTTATALAIWLNEVATNAPEVGQSYDGCPGGVLKKVWHAALQGLDGVTGDGFNPLAGSAVGDEKHIKKPQMNGGPACFGILTTKKEYATWLPHKLNLMVVSHLKSLVDRNQS